MRRLLDRSLAQHNAGVILIPPFGTSDSSGFLRIYRCSLTMLLLMRPANHPQTVLSLAGVLSVSQLRRSEHDAVGGARIHPLEESLNLLVLEVGNLDEGRHCNCSFLTSHYQQSRRENNCPDFGLGEEGVEDALAC